MMKTRIIIASAGIAALLVMACVTMNNRQARNWAEGHMTRSPDNRWLVLMRSTSAPSPEESFINLLVFDTDLYPDLKADKAAPSKVHRQNPHASYVIPVQMYARMTTFRWNDERHVVEITQGQVNALEPLTYRLDLETFSLTKVEK